MYCMPSYTLHALLCTQAEAEAAYEAMKQEVEEKTREEAEAKAADQQVGLPFKALCNFMPVLVA